LNKEITNLRLEDIINLLKEGNPPIYVYRTKNAILFNTSTLCDGDEDKIVKRIREILHEYIP